MAEIDLAINGVEAAKVTDEVKENDQVVFNVNANHLRPRGAKNGSP